MAKKEETAEYFTNISNDFSTELYRDFLARFEEKFLQDVAIDVNDILTPAREIFLDYFNELEMEVP